MPEVNQPAAGGAAPRFDAFLSYSSQDSRVVHRIQRFLESYRFGKPRRRVRVYLDRTDIRGGELGKELQDALADSAHLIVCLSPAAADSRWVALEAAHFLSIRGASAIAQVRIGGKAEELPSIKGIATRFHDLRRRFIWRFSLPGVRLELLRLLAFITNVELRSLRNWYLRRLARNALVAAAALAVLLLYPVRQWEELKQAGRQPIYPIAAEVRDGRLWAAARLRAAGPQGFRNYIGQTSDLLRSDGLSFANRDELSSRRRLMPSSLLNREVRTALPALDLQAQAARFDGRAPVGQPFIGQPAPDVHVVVQPVSPTPEELDAANDNAADFGTPIPDSAGSLVVVFTAREPSVSYVPALNVALYPPGGPRDPLSPSHVPSIAWTGAGEGWIGVRGVDGHTTGGLWETRDSGKSWNRVENFASVSSIAFEAPEGAPPTLTVAETHVDLWRGISLVPYSSRVVRRSGRDASWVAASMPPFGTRSEIELCGELDGAAVVRVDEKLFVWRRVPLWRAVAGLL